MATTGLYSQHLNNRKVLHLRNTIIAIVLIILAAATLFPICYMILSSFYSGKDRIEAFSVTCSPGGYESTISTLRSFNVNSITELNNFLVTSDNTKIGALSAADFNTVKPFLNARAEPVTFESVDEMRQKMLNNEIVAGITSSNPGETDAIVTFRR